MSSINTEIIIGILSLLGTFIGTVTGIITSNKLISYRIDQLEKKVEKHNSAIEKLILSQRDFWGFVKNKAGSFVAAQ